MAYLQQHRRSARSPGHRWPALAFALLLGAGCGKTRLTQVLPPGTRVDLFPQADRAQLDALFVIDDARFMEVHQARVAASLGRFLQWLGQNQIDYHLGLVTGDVLNAPATYVGGGSARYFSSATAQDLPAAVKGLGGAGSSVVAVLQQTDLSLRAPPDGFLRSGAALFVVLVTDHNDPWSPGEDLYYFRTFKAAKGVGNDGLVTLSALVGNDPGGCSIPDPSNPSQSFFAEPAPRLIGLAGQMGGRFHGLCDPDFNAVFDDLGAAASGLRRAFRLAAEPDLTTLTVRVRARCDTLPAALAFCSAVTDECQSAAPGKVCTPPAGAVGPPAQDGYLYDATTQSILFTGRAVPPRGASVEVQYQPKAKGP